MSFSLRLIKVINYANKNVTSFGKGFDSLTVEAIRRFTKKENSNPTLPFLSEILVRYPEIDPRWLITGKGEMLQSTASPDEVVTEVQGMNLIKELMEAHQTIGLLRGEITSLRSELQPDQNENLKND